MCQAADVKAKEMQVQSRISTPQVSRSEHEELKKEMERLAHVVESMAKENTPVGEKPARSKRSWFSPRGLQAVPKPSEAASASGALVNVAANPITREEVLACQSKWAAAIVDISKVYLEEGDYVAAAGAAAGELYGYGHFDVLFKPTKATKHPFRPTGEAAMSYFVGAKAMDLDQFKGEDAGFAINGGKGWNKVVFDNHQIDLHADTATAMGSYTFTCATTGALVTVEFTFGYKRCADGKPRICLHHSSVPYKAAPTPITREEVLACQAKWATAIVDISKVYLEEGDYVAAAGAAAGELYGYGHFDVLFKPTKATKHPFRPTGEAAMSYFVGAKAMDLDQFKGEDAGFAINGGKGWSNVEFANHLINLNADTAIAMGSYSFTCATTAYVATVEFTFGYKRCEDGKARIFLHHSSVPYKA